MDVMLHEKQHNKEIEQLRAENADLKQQLQVRLFDEVKQQELEILQQNCRLYQ